MTNSINSKLVDIAEKTKDIEEFSEVRKVLTDEEIIFYYIAKNCELSETYDGEERIIKDILKVLALVCGWSRKHHRYTSIYGHERAHSCI